MEVMHYDSRTVEQNEFTLFQGGLLNHLIRRAGWGRGRFPSLADRLVLFIGVTFLPLLALSLVERTAFGAGVAVPLLHHIGVLVRFLFCVPLLFLAELLIERCALDIVRYFRTSGLVRGEDLPAFEAVVRRTSLLGAMFIPELVIVAVALLGVGLAGEIDLNVFGHASNWYRNAEGGTMMAGHWFSLVSMPVYRFLLLRWLWRYGLWAWFLFGVSRLRLTLTASHPDLAGGLRVVARGQSGFALLAFTISSQLSSHVAGMIMFHGDSLASYYYIIAGYVVLMTLLFLAPLCLFTPGLVASKWGGGLTYGALGERYTELFERQWISPGKKQDETLLGSSDIQSLADLANSFAIVRNMRVVPLDKLDFLFMALAALAPFVPLLLLEYRLEQLIREIGKLIL